MNISKQIELRMVYDNIEKDINGYHNERPNQVKAMKKRLEALNTEMRKQDFKGKKNNEALVERNYILRKMMSFLLPQDHRIFVRRKETLKEVLKEFDVIVRCYHYQGRLRAMISRYLSVNEQLDLMKTTGWTFEEKGHDKIEFIN